MTLSKFRTTVTHTTASEHATTRRGAMRTAAASFVFAGLFGGLALQPALAQQYPTRGVQIVVPFPPASGADNAIRRFVEPMAKILGQPVIIDNRPGAGGVIGTTYGAKAKADGYTLLAGTINTHALNPGLYKSLPYDPIGDFEPITRIVSFPNALAVPSSLNVTAMSQLVELAKKRHAEGKPLTYASSGGGTTAHLAGAQLANQMGVELLHVPYKGTGAALVDLMAGRVDMMFGNVPVLLPHVNSGALNALAISTPTRSTLMPNVPTVREVGMGGMEMAAWVALFAPANTPPEVVKKLHAAAFEALNSPELKGAYEKEGAMVIADTSPEEFAKGLRLEVDKWSKVIKATGASLD